MPHDDLWSVYKSLIKQLGMPPVGAALYVISMMQIYIINQYVNVGVMQASSHVRS